MAFGGEAFGFDLNQLARTQLFTYQTMRAGSIGGSYSYEPVHTQF